MKWPYKVRHRKNGPVLAKVYRPGEGRPSYRVAWRAGGKRMMKSFPSFAGPLGARVFAENLAREAAHGSQVAALSATEATTALAIRDALDHFRRETGRTVSAVTAVTEYLDAARKLAGRPLAEAVAGYLGTVATVRLVDLGVAINEFLASQKAKTQAAEGKRSQLSPDYAYMCGHFLGNFAKMFPGLALRDLTKDQLDLFFAAKRRAELAPKSRNHYRASLKQFLKWAVKKDYLPANHRLLEAPSMERETLTGGETGFFRPEELRQLLDAADDDLRPIIALCGLAGLRVQEALRLTWTDVFRVEDHIEMMASKSKTRSRRLVDTVPALAAWLAPCRHLKGPLWTAKSTQYIHRFTELRKSLKIPSRKNGLRHAFCTYHFALHDNENLTAKQAGNSPAMIHQHYKGLATKREAQAWFDVRPIRAENVIAFPAS